jgi:acyl-coenzyme A synthetase/AMP-(fatty) acid ligase
MNKPDFEDERRDYRLEVPEHFNFSRDVIDRWAEDPRRRALWWIDDHGNEREWTYAELARESRKVAGGLARLGISRGDVVLVLLPRVIEWWLTSLGCFRVGAVVSPGTIQLSAKDIAHRIQAAEAVCVVTIPEVAPSVEEAIESLGGSTKLKACIAAGGGWRPGWYGFADLLEDSSEFETADTRSDEMALLYFTSGTIGPPGHRQVLARPHRAGCSLEYHRHGMGQGGLELDLRAVAHGGDDLRPSRGEVPREACPGDPE